MFIIRFEEKSDGAYSSPIVWQPRALSSNSSSSKQSKRARVETEEARKRHGGATAADAAHPAALDALPCPEISA
ncbi:unnamed protein product [Lampetra planeri]